MKKWLALFLTVLLTTLALCGCGKNPEENSEDTLDIVTTIFPSYDFARQIAGDHANVQLLLKPGMESHSYDPSPQDMIRIRSCDLFIYVGGESDEWVRELLSSGDQQPRKVIALMDCVNTVREETVEGMEAEPEEEGDHMEYDEHVWTSPVNALIISRKISETLSELDPENSAAYRANETAYGKELSALDNSFHELTDHAANKTIVFGDRFPFRYFADEYGLTYYAAFPGCSSETEPSAATISFLIDKVKEKHLPVVFSIEFSNGKVADAICTETGAKHLTLHSCHNVTPEMFQKGVTYVELMRENLTNLKEALS